MLELEVIVVLIGLRSETYFPNRLLNLFGLHFLGTFRLLVQELAIVDETTNGRLGIGAYLNEVYLLLARHFKRLACWHNGRTVFAYDAYFSYANLLVYTILIGLSVVLHQNFLC